MSQEDVKHLHTKTTENIKVKAFFLLISMFEQFECVSMWNSDVYPSRICLTVTWKIIKNYPVTFQNHRVMFGFWGFGQKELRRTDCNKLVYFPSLAEFDRRSVWLLQNFSHHNKRQSKEKLPSELPVALQHSRVAL